jgi:CHAT domain-containing protein/predicted negative regulator of RcsB-dependent stress response
MSVNGVMQYSTRRTIRRLAVCLLAVLCVWRDAAAQEAACDDFGVALEGMRALVASYWEDREPGVLREVVEASHAARACAAEPGDMAQTYNYETWALVELDRDEEAHEAFLAFGRVVPVVADSVRWSTMYRRHGAVLLRLGRFAESQFTYARALRYAPALSLNQRVELLLAHVVALGQMAAYDEALERLDAAEALLEAHGAALPRDRFEFLLGRTLLDRADVLGLRSAERPSTRAADRARAVEEARRAVELLQGPAYETTRFRVLATLVLAQGLRRTGQQEEAMGHLHRAVAAADEHGDAMLRIQAWDDLGEGYLAGGAFDAALSAFQNALGLVLDTEYQFEPRYLYEHIGQTYERQGRLREAEDAYQESIAVVEKLRASLGTTDLAATAFAEWIDPYRRLVGLYLRTDRPREAFALLERTRARHLNDLRRGSRGLSQMDAGERARLDSLDAEIERLRATLATDPDRSGLVRARLMEVEAERYGPAAASESRPPSLPEVQRALARREQTLLTYYLDDPSYAFVVTPDAFHAIRLEVTEAAVDSLVEAVGPLWSGEAPARRPEEFDADALHALYQALFAPVRDRIPAGVPLVVVPEGRLRQVPFAMLLEAPTPRFQYADAPFLLRRHPITTDLAAALLTDTTVVANPQPLDLVAFGRSDFASSLSPSASSPEASALPDLPVVREELGALRSLFRQGVVALDGEATETALEDHLVRARVIHLASHAEVDTRRPLYSHIQLWPDAIEDGRLYLYELAGRHLPADLVVLSGCSTARGQVLAGEGMVGLHYGFRAAGAATSVGTLWHVDDEAAGALMRRFYVHLRDGLSKDRALQQAQLDYLNTADGMRASPFFWAAPVLYGSPAPIAWSHRPGLSGAAWMSLGVLLVLLGFALPRLVRRR